MTLTAPPTAATAPHMPPADAAERVRDDKDVLGGRVRPPTMPMSPRLAEDLRRMAERRRLGRSVPQWLTAEFLLKENYGGDIAVTHKSPDTGEFVVLAYGIGQVGELVRALRGEERGRITVQAIEELYPKG